MDMLSTWTGRLIILLLAFPIVMVGIPFLIATLRQRLAWDKRQPMDAQLGNTMSPRPGVRRDPAMDGLLRSGDSRRYTA